MGMEECLGNEFEINPYASYEQDKARHLLLFC